MLHSGPHPNPALFQFVSNQIVHLVNCREFQIPAIVLKKMNPPRILQVFRQLICGEHKLNLRYSKISKWQHADCFTNRGVTSIGLAHAFHTLEAYNKESKVMSTIMDFEADGDFQEC